MEKRLPSETLLDRERAYRTSGSTIRRDRVAPRSYGFGDDDAEAFTSAPERARKAFDKGYRRASTTMSIQAKQAVSMTLCFEDLLYEILAMDLAPLGRD